MSYDTQQKPGYFPLPPSEDRLSDQHSSPFLVAEATLNSITSIMYKAWGLTMILLNTCLEKFRDTETYLNHLKLGCR
jgi:hypothetical protein